jgi:hypothetical protein
LATFAYNIKHVTLAVLNAGDESAPMTPVIPRQQTAVIALPMIEIANHMHRFRMRSPDAKCRAVADKVRAHWGVGANILEGCGHKILQQESFYPL